MNHPHPPLWRGSLRSESELGWKAPEEHLMPESGDIAVVNSLLCHLLMTSEPVLGSQDGRCTLFFFYLHTHLILNSQDICLFIFIVPDNNSKPLEGKIVFKNAVSHFICLMI